MLHVRIEGGKDEREEEKYVITKKLREESTWKIETRMGG
jgi:hypothetical protein